MTDRTRARALAQESLARGDAVGWFERLYAEAGRGEAIVPWADLAPNPHVVEWLERESPAPGRALDVGCGLGDTAEDLVRRGFDFVAFDVSQSAVDEARRRFPASRVDYRVADLRHLPDDFGAAFHLVSATRFRCCLPAHARARARRCAGRSRRAAHCWSWRAAASPRSRPGRCPGRSHAQRSRRSRPASCGSSPSRISSTARIRRCGASAPCSAAACYRTNDWLNGLAVVTSTLMKPCAAAT